MEQSEVKSLSPEKQLFKATFAQPDDNQACPMRFQQSIRAYKYKGYVFL
jgi:hypothetical protein